MYIPSHFTLDQAAQLSLIKQYPFAELISYHKGNLEVNQLPFLLSEDNRFLLGHVAKNNEHWKALEDADELRVCFHGPNTYISPTWYKNNQNVPTWNYTSVQVTGKASLLQRIELIDLLDKLSQVHEAKFEQPWTINKLSEKRLNAMCNAIVGFKIKITGIEGKAKLSQNKSKDEVNNLIDRLNAQGDYQSIRVANEMKKQLESN